MHPTAAADSSNRRYSQALPLRLARFSFKPRAVASERSAVPIKLGACSGQQDHKSQQSGAPGPGHETEQQLIGHTLGRPFLNKVNGGRFSIHQQEVAPFEIFHYVIAPSRSKFALVLRHQTMQAGPIFADFLPRGVLSVTTWHLVNPLIVPTAARLGELS